MMMRRRELFKRAAMAGLGAAVSSVVTPHPTKGAPDPKGSGTAPPTLAPLQFQLFSRLNDLGKAELAFSREGPWTPVVAGDTFGGLDVLAVPMKGHDRSWIVLERDEAAGGEFIYVDHSGVVCQIGKPLGRVGMQTPPVIEARPREYWDKLLNAEDDILGKRYLADPRDPSLERTREFYPPLMYPETYVGMKEYPHEVPVSWDGSIGVDRGFFTGDEMLSEGELPAALPFALNGREIDMSEGLQVLRRQLESYLPITQYVYQRAGEETGWEQLALMGNVRGKPVLLLRFRLVNYSPQDKKVEFAFHPPLEGRLELQSETRTLSVTAPAFSHDGRRTTHQPVQAAVISQEAFKEQDNVPVWAFQLGSQEHRDLYFALPGYCSSGRLTLSPDEVREAFCEALLGECRSWQQFLARGAQFEIPEPTVSEISKGALVKCLVCVDGDEVRGGAVWYEGFWVSCVFSLSTVLLELGYFEEVRRYLTYFMKTRVEPSGKFNTATWSESIGNYDISTAGDFLKLLACYYWYSHDASLITEHISLIDRVIAYVQQNREQSLRNFPPGDPRHGMVQGIMNNDWPDQPGFYYRLDAAIWEGFRNYAQALEEIGVVMGRSEYVAKGKSLAQYAKEYYAAMRKSFETAVEREGGRVSFVHIHPVLGNPPRPLRCIFITDMKYRRNRRWHEWPRLVSTDFLTDEERRGIFDYEFNHEGTVLGVRRYEPTILDNFETYCSAYQKLRLGMVREFLMEYYGNIQALLGPGLWSGFEQVQVVPMDGEKGRRNGYAEYKKASRMFGLEGAHATWPTARLTKQIFAFDEPNGEAVWVGRGIPRHWLTSGRAVQALGLPTRYGKLNIRYIYASEARILTVKIEPLERRTIPELRIGARDPEGGTLRSVRCNTLNGQCKTDRERELIVVTGVDRPLSLQISYE
jgi:hypothetical protein